MESEEGLGNIQAVPDILDSVEFDVFSLEHELLYPIQSPDNSIGQLTGINKLIKYIEYQLNRNENVFIIIDGRTQMGKSTMAIMIARALGKYDIHNVQFGIDGFRSLINEKLPEGSVIIYDDPQTEFNSQDWQQKRVKTLTRISQTMGNRHYVLILTTPNIGSIPGQIQWLMTVYLQGDDYQKGLFYTKRPVRKKNITMKNKDIYYQYIRMHIPGTKKMIKLKTIQTDILPQKIYNEYNEKKNEFMEGFYLPAETVRTKRKVNPNSLKNLRPFKNKTDAEIKEIKRKNKK